MPDDDKEIWYLAPEEVWYLVPSKSNKQRRALYAKKGAAWVKKHGFDKVSRKGGSHKKKG